MKAGLRLHLPVQLCPGHAGHGLTTVVSPGNEGRGSGQWICGYVGGNFQNHPKELQKGLREVKSSFCFWKGLKKTKNKKP